MWIGHRKEIRKLTFRALALRWLSWILPPTQHHRERRAVQGKTNCWKKKKKTDFPFNFYIVTFGEKKPARLGRESLTTFSKSRHICIFICILFLSKAWFKRRILHAPNQILILVDSNEYVRLIWFKRRIVLPNKIAEREWRVLNSHSSKHKLFNIISIQFGTCKMWHLNQLSKFSRIFDWISRIFDWLASNWNMSHLIDLDVAFYMHLIWQFDSAHVKCDV